MESSQRREQGDRSIHEIGFETQPQLQIQSHRLLPLFQEGDGLRDDNIKELKN